MIIRRVDIQEPHFWPVTYEGPENIQPRCMAGPIYAWLRGGTSCLHIHPIRSDCHWTSKTLVRCGALQVCGENRLIWINDTRQVNAIIAVVAQIKEPISLKLSLD